MGVGRLATDAPTPLTLVAILPPGPGVCVCERWMGTWGVGALVLSWGWCPGGEGQATVDRRDFVPDAALLIRLGPDKEPSVSGNVPPAAGTAPPPPQEAQPQPCLSHQSPLFPRQWNPDSDTSQLRPEATPSSPPPHPANVLSEAFPPCLGCAGWIVLGHSVGWGMPVPPLQQ